MEDDFVFGDLKVAQTVSFIGHFGIKVEFVRTERSKKRFNHMMIAINANNGHARKPHVA